MDQRQEQPIHWDNHRSSFNLTLIFALIVAVIGVLGQPPLLIIGLGVAAYSWLTSPKQYLIYKDRLVIIYGRPRVKPIPFAEISHLETVALPTGERLRLRMVNGRRLMVMAKDPDTFRARLDEALSGYHGEDWGADHVEGTIAGESQPEDFGRRSTFEGPAEEPTVFGAEADEPPPFNAESGLSSDEDPRGPTTPY
jgi:hypothetical protein